MLLAERGKAIEEVDAGMIALAELLASDERLARFMAAPQIPAAEKRVLIDRGFGEKLHPALVRFLHLLVSKRREPLLGEIAAAWRQLLDERANRMTATLVTAAKIDDELAESVRGALEELTGKHIVLEQEIDPALLAGVVVRFGDTVVDGSVRSRLTELRHRLRTAHVGSHD